MVARRLESEETSAAHRIMISSVRKHAGTDWNVYGHLPEEFGFSVGSEIGTPFAGFASDGNVSKVLYLTTGSSAKTGVITKKLFMGPEQSEINFDMKFDAYYSGFHEVVEPIVRLMVFSVGHQKSIAEIGQQLSSLFALGNPVVSILEETSLDKENKPTFSFMQGPGLCRIRFGRVFKMNNVYLASVEPNFSNSLDNEGYPLSATVSINGQLQEPMTKEELVNGFSRTKERIFISEDERDRRSFGDSFGLAEKHQDDENSFKFD